MEFTEFNQLCRNIFAINADLPQVDDDKTFKLFLLTKRMLEVNRSMNLTAIKEEKAIILKHYADSLTICKYLPKNATLADIGCGAGFPTLPLAIFRPDLKITAIDSTAKRIDYVNETASFLNLDNISAISARAEELGVLKEYRERFDVVTARAVASLPVLTELCLPLVKIGGTFIAMKAQKADEEIRASQNAIQKCGGVMLRSEICSLTDDKINFENRTIVLISKVSSTPKEFPRHFSKISKKPL